MRQAYFEIISNRAVARGIYELKLSGDTGGIVPGQFCELQLDGFFLRRPFSVCDANNGVLTLVYKLSGEGTRALSNMRSGKLQLLCALGNGFDIAAAGDRPLLIAGGTGFTPLYFLARELSERGVRARVIMGFASAAESVYADEFKALGAELCLMTEDGSAGRRGLVTDAMNETDYTQLYACGPMPMLRAIAARLKAPAQFSLEARMGCGFGACMGCTIETGAGYKRVCRDGPVFKAEELIW